MSVAPAGPAVQPHAWLRAYVALGANLGDALGTLEAALVDLAALPVTQFAGCSAPWRSAPVGAVGPDFINAVAALDTALSPEALLEHLMRIERVHGRVRSAPNAPRTLDLDLLIHGNEQRCTPDLHLPHPRLHLRAFVLRPLLQVAPSITLSPLGRLDAYLPAVADQALTELGGGWRRTPTIAPASQGDDGLMNDR